MRIVALLMGTLSSFAIEFQEYDRAIAFAVLAVAAAVLSLQPDGFSRRVRDEITKREQQP